MSKPKSRKYVEEYDSDNGFVEDAPKSKKQKKSAVSGEMMKADDGNEYWELSGRRRVTVSDFKGTMMVSLREYYEKDGKSLPGKKGIALNMEQYTTLIDLLPNIESLLKAKGVDVPRPQYGTKAADSPQDAPEAADEDGEEEAPSHKGKLDKFKMGKEKKKNHEVTSDEDED